MPADSPVEVVYVHAGSVVYTDLSGRVTTRVELPADLANSEVTLGPE